MAKLDLGKFGKVASPITTEQGVLTVAEYIAVDESNEQNLKEKLEELESSIGSGGGSYTLPVASSSELGGIMVMGSALATEQLEGRVPCRIGTDRIAGILVDTEDFNIDGTGKLSIKEGAGGGTGSTGSITVGTGLEKLPSGAIVVKAFRGIEVGGTGVSVKVGDGLIFDANNAVSVQAGHGISVGSDVSVNFLRPANDPAALAIGTTADLSVNSLDVVFVFGNAGSYPGPRTVYFQKFPAGASSGWPLEGTVTGYITVTKGYDGDLTKAVHTQTLYVANGESGDYKVFLRQGVSSIDANDTVAPTWQEWREMQTMALCGNGSPIDLTDLDNYVDNGTYGGIVYSSDAAFDASGNLTAGTVETFTMVVVNNYAMTSVVSEMLKGQGIIASFPKQVTQYKISTPLYGEAFKIGVAPDPALYKSEVKVRTGVWNANAPESWVWTEWSNAGGVTII